jgi:hypothetical protein
MTKILNIKCPHCKKQFNYYSSEFRPFCSERCKLVDLGAWASGDYAIASKSPLSDQDIELVLALSAKEEDDE